MALLYRNLERAGVRAPEHDVLKGNWRYHWYLNKSRLKEFAQLQAQLVERGIPVVTLKGIPLAAFYYEDVGVRPMGDFDVMVPRRQAREAVDYLLSKGYRPKWGYSDDRIFKANGTGFIKDGVTELDLHWGVLHECREAWSDDAFWSGMQTRVFDGLSLCFLRTEDQILHLCAHGMRYAEISPLRWLADVTVVLRREGHCLDMDYLLREAGRREMLNPLKRTFVWLDQHLDLPCAPQLRWAIGRMHPSWSERIDYFWRAYPVKGLPGLVPLWGEHWRSRIGLSVKNKHAGFLVFYAGRNKISGEGAAAAHITLMFTKRVLPWLVRRAVDWARERGTELWRGGGDDARGARAVV